MSESAPFKVLEGPRVSHPINGIGGLYIHILVESDVKKSDCLPALYDLARKHGYNPGGRGAFGPPCSYGLNTVTHAVWFHDKQT